MPPRTLARAVRIQSREAAALRAENLRASLPLGQYLSLLHEAAVSGELPQLTRDGTPTGQSTPIAPTERMRLLQYLVDKAMPAPAHPNESTPLDPTAALRDLTPEQVRNLTLSELQQLLVPPTAPATPDHDS